MRTPFCFAIAAMLLLASVGPAGAADVAKAASPAAGPALKVTIDKSKVDKVAHRLEVKLSQVASKIWIRVTGESGDVLADEEQDFAGRPPGTPLTVTWTPTSDEPLARIDVKATDTRGFFTGVALLAWGVSVPHQEVNFRTDSAEIDAGEVGKLEESFKLCTEILAKKKATHDDGHPETLYIAGHTDTVGSAASNLKLSQARARAIAGWFRKSGIGIPILYEGFGETSLRVGTADQVDEPRNRRTDYYIGLDEPMIKTTGFHPVWKRLN